MRRITCLALALAAMVGPLALPLRTARAYVEIPYTLGRIVQEATFIVSMRVEKVDKEKRIIVYRKVADLKGKYAGEQIKHTLSNGFEPREYTTILDWAEPGKLAVFFHNGSASETCIDGYWYQAYPQGEWWNMSHAEPFFLRSFAGKPEKLAAAVPAMVAGQEVVVPCMVDGDKNALKSRSAKIQRLKASTKLMDYNAKRDFVGWGGEDIRRLAGMPGFTHYGALSRVDPGAGGVAIADFEGKGKPGFCLFGAGRVAVLQNGGNQFSEIALPQAGGARAAAWADFNGDQQPDLLLATPSGPRLYANIGEGNFRDDSDSLPSEPYRNLTAAAWIDFNGDGKPDILLADGFRGLRLYQNIVTPQALVASAPPKFGKWHVFGPCNGGFDQSFEPERGVDLKQTGAGKNGEKSAWQQRDFAEGQINSLAIYQPQNNENVSCYVYREIEVVGATELPISLGSDDSLKVWLNGEKLVAENAARAAAPDQHVLRLKLKTGRNELLMKIGQGNGDWGYYFAAGKPSNPAIPLFEDVTEKYGLGPDGIAGKVKGSALAVTDVDGDGRQDFLFGAGSGVLVLNKPQGFVEAKGSGLAFNTAKTTPIFGDFDGDKLPDLFVPHKDGCKLFRNLGGGKFQDVTAASGLAQITKAACGTWTDFNGDGKLDLMIGCVGATNRYFRNTGGKFVDSGDELGFDQRVFNTHAIGVVDLNKDGALDLVLNNEGQDPAVLLGKPAAPKGATASR